MTDYGQSKTFREILFFYVIHYMVAVIASGFWAAILGIAIGRGDDAQFGAYIAIVVGTAFPLIISSVIVYKKHLTHDISSLILVLLSGVAGYVGGPLLGLLFSAYLCSKPARFVPQKTDTPHTTQTEHVIMSH